jgi:riboflavin synthase
MFTGLITSIGEVRRAEGGRFEIACGYALGEDHIGASIAVDGCCLTLIGIRPCADGFKSLFTLDVSNETQARTTLGSWTQGRKVNLERPLTPSSELGGHIVTGHVDGIARILERRKDGESARFTVEVDENLARFIAPKGCIALNGVSLTVNEVEGRKFGVNLIPHTLVATTWDGLGVNDTVNVEVDLLARYVARITHVET